MNRRCLHAAAFALLAVLPGCDEEAFTRGQTQRHPASSAPPATAAPAPAVSPSDASHASSGSPFAVVARSPDAFEIYPLRGTLLVDAAGFLAVLGDGPLRQSPAIMRGLEKGQSGRILGGWPDVAWIAGGQDALRWSGDHWAEAPELRPPGVQPNERLLDLTALGDGRAVAAIGMPGNDLRFVLFAFPDAPKLKGPMFPGGGPFRAPLAARAEPAAAPPPGEGEAAPCQARMKPDRVFLAGLPTMEVFAAGQACEPGGAGGPIVERWPPGSDVGIVDVLPEPESGHVPRLAGVLAWSANEVIVYGGEGASVTMGGTPIPPAAPYLARFDGNRWSLETAPFGGGVDTLATAEDGTLWAAAGGAAWRRPVGGAWAAVPLPAGVTVQAVWPRTAADVWAAGREHDAKARAVLLRTGGSAAEAIRLPPRNAMAGAIASGRGFHATAACDRVFVTLYILERTKEEQAGKPVQKDFPDLKSLFEGELAGLTPVVDDGGGPKLRVGVAVPSRELGRKLAAAYQELFPHASPNLSPSLSCYEPASAKAAPAAPALPPRPAPRPGPIRHPRKPPG